MVDKKQIATEFMKLQDEICSELESFDEKGKFHEDPWIRKEGGGGRSRVIQEGRLFEKGGVNFSEVFGDTPAFLLNKSDIPKSTEQFYATGVSIVIHPLNPWVPIIHMNIRYFEKDSGECWFGGGIDLTPHYVDPVDAKYFHEHLAKLCSLHECANYADFKKNADDYFFIPHRNETRGIGGIFFDHLIPGKDFKKNELFDFVIGVGKLFTPLYIELVKRKMNQEFNNRELKWQRLRRGRYVEFNLIYDKGTKFGLETNGRIESILMSLPPQADWVYNFEPKEGSEEFLTLRYLKRGICW